MGKFFYLVFFSNGTQKVFGANMQAPAKGLAIGVRATIAAKAALQAAVAQLVKLGQGRQSLGVMAPCTAQGATLKKDCCANSLTVANGKFFDIKNRCFHITVCTPALQ